MTPAEIINYIDYPPDDDTSSYDETYDKIIAALYNLYTVMFGYRAELPMSIQKALAILNDMKAIKEE